MAYISDIGSVIVAVLGDPVPQIVRRHTTDTYSANGIFIPGTTIEVEIVGVFQPAGAADMERVPEGHRTRAGMVVFTVSQLQMSDVFSGQRADEFTRDGHEWEVSAIEDWTLQANYMLIIATRVDP